jgi:undecaprenyl diphosphate synthase
MNERAEQGLHVGIIMDGNGRWARARGLVRAAGHREGAARVTGIVRACPPLGVTHLTLYAFSTENWRRPAAEVVGLLRLIGQTIERKTEALRAEGVRLRFIGRRDRLPAPLLALMERTEARTATCRSLHLTIAVDYGGRDDIARALQATAQRVASGALRADAIHPGVIAAQLDTADLPDPDLVIRTSGEQRLSNFLLWQGAAAEFAFPPIAWPDFDRHALAAIVAEHRARLALASGPPQPARRASF